MRVSVYVRVSTQHQAQSQTIEQQVERLRQYITQQGWTLTEGDIFRDDGYSGARLNRPGLDRLREAIRAGEVAHVLLTAPDRLARNYVHQVLLLDEFQNAGCLVEFLDRPMSQDPHDQLLLQIRGAVAEYERTLIAERMRLGRQRKFRAGQLLPWTHVPFGYRVDPEHPRDPHGVRVEETEAVWVREMYTWYAQAGRSLLSLAKHLQDLKVLTPNGKRRWNQATLRNMLMNPAYTGQVYVNRTRPIPARGRRSPLQAVGRKPGGHVVLPREQWLLVTTIPAIITQEQFDAVQAKLAQNQQFATRHNTTSDYLLRGLVSCGVCHLGCVGRARTPEYRYYVCRGKADPILACRDEKCTARFIPAAQLDDLVWQDLCDVLMHPEILSYALMRAHGEHWLPQDLQARREALRRARQSLATQSERWTEAYLHAVIALPEYERRRAELQLKVDALTAQENQLTHQVDQQAHLSALADSMTHFCQRVQTGLASATFEQKRQLLELLIDRVVVTNDQVEIRYVIPTSKTGEQSRFCHLRIDYFRVPTVTVVLQDGPNTQRRIRAQEVSGMTIPPSPFGKDRYHRFGVAAQPTHHRACGVCAGARGRTHDDGGDALMAKMGPPLTQGTVVDNPVGLGGTDPVPAV
jgi:site-specific DNA recombinase